MWYFATSNPALPGRASASAGVLFAGGCMSFMIMSASASWVVAGATKRLEVLGFFEGYISNTSTTSPASNRKWHVFSEKLDYKALHVPLHDMQLLETTPERQHPWFGDKTAFFAHKVVSDWHVWKPLILMQWWAMGDTLWAKRLHQAGHHQASPGSLARCWPKGSWAVAHPKRRTNQIQHAKRCVAIPQDISRQQRDLMWE